MEVMRAEVGGRTTCTTATPSRCAGGCLHSVLCLVHETFCFKSPSCAICHHVHVRLFRSFGLPISDWYKFCCTAFPPPLRLTSPCANSPDPPPMMRIGNLPLEFLSSSLEGTTGEADAAIGNEAATSMTSEISGGKEGGGAAMVVGGGKSSYGRHVRWRLDSMAR